MNEVAHQISARDSWIFDNSIKISLPAGLSAQEIQKRLKNSRQQLEQFKNDYYYKFKQAPENKKEIIKRSYFQNIARIAQSIALMKDTLALEGAGFEDDWKDIEHPDDAFERIHQNDPAVIKARQEEAMVFGVLIAGALVLFALYWLYNQIIWLYDKLAHHW